MYRKVLFPLLCILLIALTMFAMPVGTGEMDTEPAPASAITTGTAMSVQAVEVTTAPLPVEGTRAELSVSQFLLTSALLLLAVVIFNKRTTLKSSIPMFFTSRGPGLFPLKSPT